LSAQQLLEAYSCRWQIEVLFKTWKSHFQLGRLPSCNPLWVQIQLLVKLLAIALLQSTFAPNLFVAELRALSPLKIAAYFSRLLPLITASDMARRITVPFMAHRLELPNPGLKFLAEIWSPFSNSNPAGRVFFHQRRNGVAPCEGRD
jgi:hypothetical protein